MSSRLHAVLQFVIAARNPSTVLDVCFAMRVFAAVRARDSSLIAAKPTRAAEGG